MADERANVADAPLAESADSGSKRFRAGSHRRIGSSAYPVLDRWPKLRPAVAVHTNVGTNEARLRVPIKLLRDGGFAPERGMHGAVCEGHLILWNEKGEGPYRQGVEGQLSLTRRGLGPALNQRTFAIVQGPDYLILTTEADALRLAPHAPVAAYAQWTRMARGIAAVRENDFEVEPTSVLGWNDFSVTQTNPRRPSPTAKVAGGVWRLAGFAANDPVQFIRYPNATLVQKCKPSVQHSVLGSQKGSRALTHYFGPTLFDVHGTDRVRAVAIPDGLVITLPSSTIGISSEMRGPAHTQKLTPVYTPEGHLLEPACFPLSKETRDRAQSCDLTAPCPLAKLVSLNPKTLDVIAWKEFSGNRMRVFVSGGIWERAGFANGDPVRAVRYANGLVLERCDDEHRSWYLGRSETHTYHTFALAKVGLADATRIRAIASKGRLILTAAKSDLGQRCVAYQRMSACQTRTQQEVRRSKRTTSAADLRLPKHVAHTVDETLLVPPDAIVAWRDYPVVAGQKKLMLSDALVRAAGLTTLSPVRIERYQNGAAIDTTTPERADRPLCSPRALAPSLSLAMLGLSGLRHVRVLATPGRIVLAAQGSDIGKLCAEFDSERVGYGKRFNKPVRPDTEVGQYPMPEGRRLQVQGKWLAQYGFTPGARISVTRADGALLVTLTSNHDGTAVTEHSPGRPKLYIPAAELKQLNSARIAVRARNGVLRLVPLAA